MFQWLLNLFGSRGLGISELARRLEMKESDLIQVDCSYHEFSIKKKSGNLRLIAAPNPQLKGIQRRILRRLIAKLAVHAQATGFQPGLSFVDNARCHQSQAVVIKIDLIDFFLSTDSRRIEQFFRFVGWNRKAAQLLTKLTTHRGALPQGAPTSPRLSNLVNFKLDSRLAGLAKSYHAIYTRYADDITISLNVEQAEEIHGLIETVLRIIRESDYRPHIGKKFDVRRAHQRQVVTGLVVNDRANLPREKRRWLRAVEHRHGQLKTGGNFSNRPTLSAEQLAGWQSLRKMIDDV